MIKKPINHVCNCQYCTQRTTCLICGTDKNLHRAHIIPRNIVSCIIENSEDKDRLMSYSEDNVFILCEKHHRAFDCFKMPLREVVHIYPYLDIGYRDFISFLNTKSVKEKDRKKIDRWADKTNKWLFGGSEVIRIWYE